MTYTIHLSHDKSSRRLPPRFLTWTRFNWDLTKLLPVKSEVPDHYQIALATRDDQTELRKVFSSSFMLDPIWNPALHDVMRAVDCWLRRAFVSDSSRCLALRHGHRIIGASILWVDPAAENHLAPGPSILMEYRNRGFGTFLFERSLDLLRQAGVVRATGIAREDARLWHDFFIQNSTVSTNRSTSRCFTLRNR